jgi:hypothetical protein
MPNSYVLALAALTLGGMFGSFLSIALLDRATKLPPDWAGFVGLVSWFALSSGAVWLRFTQIDNALAAQHDRNIGVLVAYLAIWIALSVIGTLLGGILASLVGRRSKPASQ